MASDSIRLSGLTFYGYHGVLPEERRLGQRFVVELELFLDLAPAGHSDDLHDTVNYSDLYGLVRDVVEGIPRNLLEAVAEQIAAAVLQQTGAESVRVRVAKPWAPVKGMAAGEVSVEIVRPRRPSP